MNGAADANLLAVGLTTEFLRSETSGHREETSVFTNALGGTSPLGAAADGDGRDGRSGRKMPVRMTETR